jgi:hypothetical protein
MGPDRFFNLNWIGEIQESQKAFNGICIKIFIIIYRKVLFFFQSIEKLTYRLPSHLDSKFWTTIRNELLIGSEKIESISLYTLRELSM